MTLLSQGSQAFGRGLDMLLSVQPAGMFVSCHKAK